MIYLKPDLKVERFTVSAEFAAMDVLSGPESSLPGFVDESNTPDPDKPVTEEVFDNVFSIF